MGRNPTTRHDHVKLHTLKMSPYPHPESIKKLAFYLLHLQPFKLSVDISSAGNDIILAIIRSLSETEDLTIERDFTGFWRLYSLPNLKHVTTPLLHRLEELPEGMETITLDHLSENVLFVKFLTNLNVLCLNCVGTYLRKNC